MRPSKNSQEAILKGPISKERSASQPITGTPPTRTPLTKEPITYGQTPKETITAVKLLLQYLKAEGVEYIFGIPGGPLMPLYEAIFETGDIIPIMAKHEEGAAFMADGYARATGRLGVCCVTSGPGCTNATTGIAVSYSDGIPLLIVTAQVATSAFGRGAIQESSGYEVDVVDLFKPITRASVMLIRADKMGETIRHLLRVAMNGKRGPVHLNIPADLAKKPVPIEKIYSMKPQYTTMNFDRDAIKTASKWLIRAKRPAILAGNGANLSGAHPELKKLSERLLIPVATTVKAKGVFPEDHILSLGVFGFAGSPRSEAYLLEGEVDVLLAIGTSLGEDATSGWDVRLSPQEALLHIDIDPIGVGKNYPVTVPLIGDAKAILNELLYQVDRDVKWLEGGKKSLDDITKFRARYPWCVDEEKMDSDAIPLKPQRLMKDLAQVLPQDAVIFCDMGNNMAWAFHYLKLTRPNSFYHCLGFASMGHGTAASIGAKLAFPNRPVIAIVGDAAFAMNGMEIHTAVENDIPVIWLIQNNGGHGMVYHGEQIQFGNRFHHSLFQKPMDLCKMAEAMGAVSFRVTDPGQLCTVLPQALACGKAVVIDAVIDVEERPPIGSRMKSLDRFFEDEPATLE